VKNVFGDGSLSSFGLKSLVGVAKMIWRLCSSILNLLPPRSVAAVRLRKRRSELRRRTPEERLRKIWQKVLPLVGNSENPEVESDELKGTQ